MVLNSSTSSSNRSWRMPWVSFGILALSWVGYLLLASPVANWMGERFSDEILNIGRGRIVASVAFVEARALDSVYLLTIAIVLFELTRIVSCGIARRIDPLWQWLPVSAVWFASFNVFVFMAGGTTLWWMALHLPHVNLQQTAFNIERLMLAESDAETKVVVIGSSQGQSEIDVGQLARYLRPAVNAGNLSYAGALADDMTLMHFQYQEIGPDVVVCYVSPLSLYKPVTGTRWLPLLTTNSLASFVDTDVWSLGEKVRLGQGVLGLAVPLFKQRIAFSHAMYGDVSEFGYTRPDSPLANKETAINGAVTEEPVLASWVPREDDRIRRAAVYVLGENSDYLKKSLREFLRMSAEQDRTVVLINGQVHPELTGEISSKVIKDYDKFMAELETHKNVIMLADDLKDHPAAEYTDWFHISPADRSVNTKRLAESLSKEFGWKINAEKSE